MKVIEKIDQLIAGLNELKPNLSSDSFSNEKRFNDLLQTTIDGSYSHTVANVVSEVSPESKSTSDIPSWVDPNYQYDPNNPRKPNMRELMEAISGNEVEILYLGGDWHEVSAQASELLYGVVGSKTDTRDWEAIMEADNIINATREETGMMHEAKVDIVSFYDESNGLKEQVAVLKDKQGNILRTLPNDISKAEQTLQNFGANKDSVPVNLEEKVDESKFNKELLAFLKNFSHKTETLEKLVFKSATDAISAKLAQEIPADEIGKL